VKRHKLSRALRLGAVCTRCPRDRARISWVDTASVTR
jgi:hypothetical protein